MKRQLVHTYQDVISLENLCSAWQQFIFEKKTKIDVLKFERNLMDNIVELHTDLVNRTYCHGRYESFFINDPKRRHIHKASVRDRLLHHAVYRILYPFFDRTFIADSFSCRVDKGMHRAINRFREFGFQVSKNHTRTCWVLKCDIKQFFASVDQGILMQILVQYIPDVDILNLLTNILDSFSTEGNPHTGLPLGNLTSQLLANIYMNQFDQWVKHTLQAKYYARYADDFVFFSHDRQSLVELIPKVRDYLVETLNLTLHPKKIFLNSVASGMDFLGWVHFPDHRVLRNTTKRRMLRRIKDHPTDETLQSYLGLLSHGNTSNLQEEATILHWLFQ